MRYGDLMRPLNIEFLKLSETERSDERVLRFIVVADETLRAEKISDPSSWSDTETRAYATGDTALFSRLRGYSSDEISRFQEFLLLASELDEHYGVDYSAALTHEMSVQTHRLTIDLAGV